jgi:hypothetical protein
MRTNAIVIYSSSQKRSHEVECFITETQSREGKPGKVFRVHDGKDFRIKVEVYHPYLVFIETNCWYELTAWKLAQYRAKYRQMEICVFTYDRLLPTQAAGLMRGGAGSFLDLRDEDEVTRAGIKRIIRGDVYMPEWVSAAEEDEQEHRKTPSSRPMGFGNSIVTPAVRFFYRFIFLS